ncbi:hypothetical protein BU24DRAFT_365047 [Aaosphaeria arxii CBS 175.79]|uniref:Uncharacterized protein n=1 Tax=Aaosphaeria arxii CBS 175.79 TaxID=1450172 RepID=A0A6A5Y204_9PLEO|nr:uncharacterized protein BU24DRAFT_365047 [Aaosphaeria arxii CBS 175.79]KAF2019528.1 hypothetical protein BU24DRAFT_365047 [Aaosphaeria arxii CBS 175.79]
MAEGLGIAASIIEIFRFGKSIYDRLAQYRDVVGNLPEAFAHVQNRLGILLDVLETTRLAAEAGALPSRAVRALNPVMRGCKEKIVDLETIMNKLLPREEMSGLQKSWIAVKSLKYDKRIQQITKVIGEYESSLTLHAASAKYQELEARPRPKPASTVPFRQDHNFVERESLLSVLEERCPKPAARVALVGLGGVGKSQLAVEYSYRFRARYPERWVFWVHAGSTSNIEQGFATLAEKASIPAWDPTDRNRFSVITKWLADEANGSWLIIIDNADDLGVFSRQAEPSNKKKKKNQLPSGLPIDDLLQLFPESPNGSYLFTSRSKETAYRLTGDHNDILDVEPMSEQEAVILLHKRVTGIVSQEDASNLVAAVDYMPLAITQAAVYINENQPRVTVKKYLDALKQGDHIRTKLLEESIYDARRDGQRSNSIIVTWHISFQCIMGKRKSAARLLGLMALFDRNDIPEILLHGQYAQEDGTTNARQQRLLQLANYMQDRNAPRNSKRHPEADDFQKDWNILTRFSLITTNLEGDHFAMHNLVQYSMRTWLHIHGELSHWVDRHLRLMEMSYPTIPDHTSELCLRWLPHASAALSHEVSNKKMLEIWASLTEKIAEYMSTVIGAGADTEALLSLAVKAYDSSLGPNHDRSLACSESLGFFLATHRRCEKAEVFRRKVLLAREKKYGRKSKKLLFSLDSLQETLEVLKKHDEAGELFHRAVTIRLKAFGGSHHETQRSLNQRGVELLSEGYYEEAEGVWRQAFELRQHDHSAAEKYDPRWAQQLHALGGRVGIFRDNWAKQEKIMLEAYEYNSRFLEKHHHTMIRNVEEIAVALVQQQKYEEAVPWFRKALEAHAAASNEKTEDALLTVHQLSLVFLELNRLDEALTMAQELVKARETSTGGNLADLAGARHGLANIMHKKGLFDEAGQLYEQAHITLVQEMGDNHDRTKDVLADWTRLRKDMETRVQGGDGEASNSLTSQWERWGSPYTPDRRIVK